MIARTREGREIRKGTFCSLLLVNLAATACILSGTIFHALFCPAGPLSLSPLITIFYRAAMQPQTEERAWMRGARGPGRTAGDTPLCLLDILALLPAMPLLGPISDCLVGVACCWVSGRADSLKRHKSQLDYCRFKFRIFHHLLHEGTKFKCLFIPKVTV